MLATEYIASGLYKTKSTPNTVEPIYVSWIPAPSLYVKLNTDGSAVPNPGAGGIRGDFRDFNGNWLLGYSRYVPHASNLYMELLAIKEGLELAVHENFNQLIIESDSQAALLILQCDTNERLKFLTSACSSLMRRLD